MIVIDPASKGVTGTTSSNKKLKNNFKQKFITGVKAEGNLASEHTQEVTDVQSVLFLQEIDNQNNVAEQKTLQEFGNQAINLLESLHLALLKGNLTIDHLNNLKNIIQNTPQLNTPELAEFATKIKLKIEVEIAKLEVNS